MSCPLATFKITYQGATPGAMRRHLVRLKKEAYAPAGHYWHDKFRPEHFTVSGARKYHYTPRKGQPGSGVSWWVRGSRGRRWRSYMNRKQKEKGHQRPLVWSGLSEQLTRMKRVEVTGSSKKTRLRVIMHAPGLNRRPKSSQVNMYAELAQSFTPEEEQKLTEIVAVELERAMRRIRDTGVTRIP